MLGLSIVVLATIVGTGFARAMSQWRGWWRWVIAALLLLMVGVVFNIVVAIWLDPTAHNLWPIEVLAWLALVSVVVGGLHLAHWFSYRSGQT
jgi:hypothetical protein